MVVVVVQPGGDDDAATARSRPRSNSSIKRPAATTSAGCDDVQTIGFYDGVDDPNSPDYTDQAHIGNDERFPEMPALTTYPSIPPTSGPHANIPPGPLPAGVYDDAPDLARAIHSLEHGATVIWYSPSASGAQLDQLKGFYDQTIDEAAVGQDRVIVAPYDYPGEGGQLPRRRHDGPHRLASTPELRAGEPGRGLRLHLPVLRTARRRIATTPAKHPEAGASL